jgi:transitional endoplasmic reticulum ATPase
VAIDIKNPDRKGRNSLKDAPQDVVVAQVRHAGTELLVPEGMDLDEAVSLLKRRMQYLEEDMNFNEAFGYFPLDGAHALNEVLEKHFGWAIAEPIPGFFGNMPPALINVEVAPKVFKKIPWGRFALPGTEGGWIQCAATHDGNSVKFALTGLVKRKYEAMVTTIFAMVRDELAANSIYRGKAIKIRFQDDYGNDLDMPTPEFMDLTDIDESMAIYSDSVQTQITTNLLTPIVRVNDCIANNIPVKRGVMLAGTYGTGKTLAAKVAAKLSDRHNITFVYIPHAAELSKAIAFARQYQSPACVIFCEDIDRAVTGERTVEMDDILNIIDGIDTKTANIITVLTSNHLESINPALLRPGRLDAVIEVTAPDAVAVAKLLRSYGGAAITPETNLDKAAAILQGNIPAVIAEVVKRAKLAELARTPVGEIVTNLSEEAIIEAAESVKAHVELLDRRANERTPRLPALEDTLRGVITAALTGDNSRLAQVQ